MFETEYKAVFEKVTAPESSYRRIMAMTTKENKGKMPRIGTKILIAAVVISLLAVTASATGLENWFVRYFNKANQQPLSQQQIDYIESKTQELTQSQTFDGYTIGIKSAISDGVCAYITLGVTAPEGVVLNKTVIEGYDPDAPSLDLGYADSERLLKTTDGKSMAWGYTIGAEEDNDGLDNTQDILIELESGDEEGNYTSFDPNATWNLHFNQLVATYYNLAYSQQIREKYEGMENFFYDDEDGEQLWPEVVLAEGDWDFTFQLDYDGEELELVDQPVTAMRCTGWRPDGTDVMEEGTITSFKLRSLSASLYTNDKDFCPGFDYDGALQVVMKDGSVTVLDASVASVGQEFYKAASPILLDQVDHVVLADGTVLQATN